jgi:hypothetical protein
VLVGGQFWAVLLAGNVLAHSIAYRRLISGGSVRVLKVSCPRARRFFKVFFTA